MGRVVLPAKLVGETTKQVFDFASMLPVGVTINSAVTTVTVFRGTDASPSSVVSGSASVSGAQVTQGLTGGVDGVLYVVVCTATLSNGAIVTLSGFLAVTTQGLV